MTRLSFSHTQYRCPACAFPLSLFQLNSIQVWSKTTGLNSTCERLLAEQQQLRAQVEQIKAPLEYFNELERIGPLLGVPIDVMADLGEGGDKGGGSENYRDLTTNIAPSSIKVHPGSDQFLEVLRRITRRVDNADVRTVMQIHLMKNL